MGLKEELMDFIKNPPPPSEVHRAGATAAGFGVSRAVGVPPAYAAAIGAVAVIGGHYGARAWWIKSLGYGMLADAAVSAVQRSRHDDDARADAAVPALPTQGSRAAGTQPPESDIVSESQLLTMVENGDVSIPGTAPSGSAIRANPLRPYVRLEDGRVIPISEYVTLFSMKIREAQARGRARRNRRGHPELPHQTEAEYLQWVKDVCLIDAEAESLASDRGAKSSTTAESRRSRDILMPDGTYRTPENYAREFDAAIRQMLEDCFRSVRDARDNGTLPSRDVSRRDATPQISLTDIRVTPATTSPSQPVTAAQIATATAEVVRSMPSVASPTIVGKITTPSGEPRFAPVLPMHPAARVDKSRRGSNPRSR